MTVLCANCHTANRDRAMFCIGCAGKLPAFAATGPSALHALGVGSTRKKARAGTASGEAPRGLAAASAPVQRGMLIAVLLLGITVLVLAAWIVLGPSRTAPPATPMVSATTPLKALPATPAIETPTTPLQAPAQVPVEAALSAGESTVVTAPAPASVTANVAASESQPATLPLQRIEPQRSPPRVASVAATSSSRGAADPRVGCEDLFFVLAARCEARHCDQAAYTRHPRCNIVRAQRQRDEARRNLTQ